MTSTTRFSSPSDCYAIFVGSCTIEEFLQGQSAEQAVNNYCDNDWPWDEDPTEEIRAALVEYASENS